MDNRCVGKISPNQQQKTKIDPWGALTIGIIIASGFIAILGVKGVWSFLASLS